MSRHRAAWFAPAVLAAVGMWIAAPAAAQHPLEMPRLLDPARMGPVQFRIFSGRVTMHGVRFGSYSTSTSAGGRIERLTLSINDNEPVMSYESTSSTERLSIEASARDRLLIRRLPRGSSDLVPVEFEQTGRDPVRLTMGSKGHQQIYRAASLWHLLIVEREVCRESLIPLLKILHRDWNLLKAAERVESALLSTSTAYDLPDRRLWSTLVEQLGDSRFSQREVADRRLREAGRAVVTYLQQLDAGRLDAEQRYRIRRIILALSVTEDTQAPDQVAAWLSGDPAIWLIFLSRDDEPTRRLAATRLAALLGRPFSFDPGADAATRQRQIESLRKQLPAG